MMTNTSRIAASLFVGLCALYLFTASMETTVRSDGLQMLNDARALTEHGFEARMPDGSQTFSKYQLGQILLDLSIVRFQKLAMGADTIETKIPWLLAMSLLPAATGALTCMLLFLCCRSLGYRRSTSIAAALMTGLTSMIWPYTQTLFADSTIASLGMLALYALLRFRESSRLGWLFLAGASAGYAVFTKVTAITLPVVLGGYTLFLVWRSRNGNSKETSKLLAAFLAPLVVLLFATIWYNHLRYGEWFSFGYLRGVQEVGNRDVAFGFNTPLLTGLFGLLLGPGKGVFWYNPTLVLALFGFGLAWRRDRAVALVSLLVLLSCALVHAKWWAWHGDWAWGPRFLIGAVPFGYLITAPFIEFILVSKPFKRLLAGTAAILTLISLLVQIAGISVPYPNFLRLKNQYTQVFPHKLYDPVEWPVRDDMLAGHFIPEFSPIAGHLWMMRCVIGRDGDRAEELRGSPPWISVNPRWKPEGYVIDEMFHWNIWWAYCWQLRDRLGISGVLPVVFALVLLGVFAASSWSAVVAARRSEGDEPSSQ